MSVVLAWNPRFLPSAGEFQLKGGGEVERAGLCFIVRAYIGYAYVQDARFHEYIHIRLLDGYRYLTTYVDP